MMGAGSGLRGERERPRLGWLKRVKQNAKRPRTSRLALEPLEARELLTASQVVVSPDGDYFVGANFTSTEVRAFTPAEEVTEITYDTGLPTVNGYARTEASRFSLTGTAPTDTGSVVIAGTVADWSSTTGEWSRGSIPLNPGINRIYIQTYTGAAGTGTETDRHFVDVWYDTSGSTGAFLSLPMESTWEYLDDGSDQGTAWRTTDPSPAWQTGTAQLGYGDGDENTVVNRGPNNDIFVTTYFRQKFNIPAGQAALLTNITIDLLYDDGGAVYINGTEVARTSSMPGTLGDNSIAFDTWADATGTRENRIDTFTLPSNLVAGLLQDGENVIAVEIHQHDGDSSDMSFDLALNASEAGGMGIQSVSGTLPAGTTVWSAADGPYLVTSDVIVPANATLVIEPGTTVYFNGDQELHVNGRLDAQGTLDNVIRFTRQPNSSSIWGGIQLEGTMDDNVISYAVIEYGGTSNNNGMVGLDDSNLLLDHVVLDHNDRRRIRSQNSSLIVRNSVFTDIFAPGSRPTTDNISEQLWGGHIPDGGHFIIENNLFGITTGHNDIIDFDADLRPDDVVPQILNNTFLGGGDDAMDFEGDIHIEGNLVTNIIKDEYNTGSGNANGISAGGLVGPNGGHHYVVTRNVFMNMEQVAQVKENAFMTFTNNTVINANASGLYFVRPTGGVPGRGAHAVGNIFYQTPVTFDEVTENTELSGDYNILNATWLGIGTGNLTDDPMLVDPANFDFTLQHGSPAIGSGHNGTDMGAMIPPGATVAGAPTGVTSATDATITVGGADLLGYRYRINNEPWSERVAVTDFGTADQVIPPIELSNLADGTYTVYVLRQNSAGAWQAESSASRSTTWTVDTNAEPELRLVTRDSYLPGVGLLVRVEVTGEYNKPDRDLWDATVTLSSNNPNVTLSQQQVRLYNGLGSVLLTADGTEDFELTATMGDFTTSRALTSLDGVAQTNVAGVLPGTSSTWSGIIHVTGDVTVPAGHTLTIDPGTLILIDGTPGALDTNGVSIDIAGNIESLGTADQPITFTAADINAPWGELDHNGASQTIYRYTEITRAGHETRGGHTNTGPAIRSNNSTIQLEYVSVTDIAGKIMQGNNSEFVFDNTLFSRSVMGPEINNSSLLMQDSYIIDMLGIYHEGGTTDDNDGIYLHRQSAGQEIRIINSVVAHVDDDAIDTLGASIILENSIVRNADNPGTGAKGLSMIGGQNVLRYNLFVDNSTGINLKAQEPSNMVGTTVIDHLTLVGSDEGIVVEDKYGIPNPDLEYIITNSIIRATDAIVTDYDPADIKISYSNVSEAWPGDGNQTADPLFVNAAANDYHLSSTSPAIDAGVPTQTDLDGTRTDMGALPTFQTGVLGDFDGNRIVDANDIDLLCAATMVDFADPKFDLTGDGDVNSADMDYMIETVLATRYGDANLDGQVDGTDLDAWQENHFTSGGWASGNFDCIPGIDGRDFNVWLQNRFTGAAPAAAATRVTPRAASHRRPVAFAPVPQEQPKATGSEAPKRDTQVVVDDEHLADHRANRPPRAHREQVARRFADRMRHLTATIGQPEARAVDTVDALFADLA